MHSVPSPWQPAALTCCASFRAAAAGINANGERSASAESTDIIVGGPEAVAASLTANPGTLSITWTAPDSNVELGAEYGIDVIDTTPGRPATPALEFTGALTTSPSLFGHAGGGGLLAGPKRVVITSNNLETSKHGGAATYTADVVVPFSAAPTITGLVADASAVHITAALASDQRSTENVSKFQFQVSC